MSLWSRFWSLTLPPLLPVGAVALAIGWGNQSWPMGHDLSIKWGK